MASATSVGSNTPLTSSKPIPLFCTVCPDTPHFSDVSHLLTHIASKGHLHHETQTRLKSHQDVLASMALQRYEVWYKENEIESLLVDRLNTKRAKEAARRKRARPGSSTTTSSKVSKRRTKRPVEDSPTELPIKTEEDNYLDIAFLPGLLNSPEDCVDDPFQGSDALSLKGQIWPGMGKMDLANEEMKRTRNQRKPKSVIDRMRRTSEGIEPTQVIMTAEMEVERVKDVYDETSSPIPGQEESTPPRKVARPKPKRSEPLAEVSVNVQRGRKGREAQMQNTNGKKTPKSSALLHTDSSDLTSLPADLGSIKAGRNMFTDDDVLSTSFDGSIYDSPNQANGKMSVRERLGIHALNPIAQSNLITPIPNSKSAHGHNIPRYTQQASRPGQLFAPQDILGPIDNSDNGFHLHENSIFTPPVRVSQIPGVPFANFSHDHFRLPFVNHPSVKQEDYTLSMSNSDPLPSSTQTYLNISGGNPLFSQPRGFLDTYGQSSSHQPMACLGFTPINRDDRRYICDHDQKSGSFQSKDERSTLGPYEAVEKNESSRTRGLDYQSMGIWVPEAPEDDLSFHNDLGPDHPNLDLSADTFDH